MAGTTSRRSPPRADGSSGNSSRETTRVIVEKLTHGSRNKATGSHTTKALLPLQSRRAHISHRTNSPNTPHNTLQWCEQPYSTPSHAPANSTNRASANPQASRRAPRRHARRYRTAPIFANDYTRRRSCQRHSSVCSATTRSPSPCPSRRSPVSATCSARCAGRRSRRTSIVRTDEVSLEDWEKVPDAD
jgi:hypothetical protein